MFRRYECSMKFVNRLCGSVPQSVELIEPWLESRKPLARPPGAKSIDEVTEEVASTLTDMVQENAETEKRVTLGFQMVGDSLAMRGGTVKAHLKDCSRILSQNYIGKIKGERSLALRVVNCVMVEEYYIPIWKRAEEHGENAEVLSAVEAADGYFDKAIHVMTRMGPVNALKRIQYVERAVLTFHLLVMKTAGDRDVVSEDDLRKVFTYGGVHGYAGERGDGEGRYRFELQDIGEVE